MRLFLQTVLVFCIALHCYADLDTISNVLNLPNGKKLKGVLQQSFYSKRDYVEFRGLRYAHPPIGDLRFKPTHLFDDIWEPLEEDSTKYGNICPQLDQFYDPDEVEEGSWDELKVLGDEDCLFANVASSNMNPEQPLPVLVWIHGGNFQTESGHDYGVGKLMDYDMVVVNFNYRIGLLGFLNSEDGIYNGNQGLKDQTVLLEWVKRSISLFGGDPNKITLGGSNAGGVSVHLHLLSNLSRGKFQKAVIQSATAISPWVLMKDPKERLQKMAKHLKCGNDTDATVCIAEKDAVSIVRKIPKMTEWFLDPLVPFGPSIELFGPVEERFLTRDPYSLLADGNYWGRDLPVVMGVSSHEGLLHALEIGHEAMLRMVFNMEWYGAAPISLYYKKSAIDPRGISEAVRAYYFPLKDDDEKTNRSAKFVDKDFRFDNLTNLYSDRHFFVPLHHSAKLMGRNNELYLYWFDYIPEQSIHGLYGYNSSFIFGPSHYDQLQYIFVTPFFNETTKDEHVQIGERLLNGLYAFMNQGSSFFNNWKRVTSEMIEGSEPLIYNRIGNSSKPNQISEPFQERVAFWNGLFLMEYDKAGFINDFISEQEQESSAVQKDEL